MGDSRDLLLASWRIPDEPDDEGWAAKRRLAAALRRLNVLCVTSDGAGDVLDDVCGRLEEAADMLEGQPAHTFLDAYLSGAYRTDPTRYADRSLLTGLSNPLAPPMTLRFEGETSVGDVTYSDLFAGAPGLLHGGVIAASFDQVLGHNLIAKGIGTLTGWLRVDYRAPTRLGRPLRFEASLDRVEGRKYFLVATCHDGDTLTAEASALFVDVMSERFRPG